MFPVAVDHQVAVGWQQRHATPHRLPGERVQDGRFEEVDRQPFLVKRAIQQTGKHVGKQNLEETVTKTNLEAAEEIARQLRPATSAG